MGWLDGNVEWVGHGHFTEHTHHLVEEFFFFRPHLDCNDSLEVAGEHRCVQCNAFLPDQDRLRSQTHVPSNAGDSDLPKGFYEGTTAVPGAAPAHSAVGRVSSEKQTHVKMAGHVADSGGGR